jgi:ATP-dependent Clp protease ATP-binding subunit ClpA
MNSSLPLSDECERALTYAEEEAVNLSRKSVGPEHVMLGLLREEGSLAAQLLRENGADIGAYVENWPPNTTIAYDGDGNRVSAGITNT